MAWSIETKGSPATKININVMGGDVDLLWPQKTNTFDTINAKKIVWEAPLGKVSPKISTIWVETTLERDRIIALVSSGLTLTLRADTGESWSVRKNGDIKATLKDLPDRATKPVYVISIDLIGV